MNAMNGLNYLMLNYLKRKIMTSMKRKYLFFFKTIKWSCLN